MVAFFLLHPLTSMRFSLKPCRIIGDKYRRKEGRYLLIIQVILVCCYSFYFFESIKLSIFSNVDGCFCYTGGSCLNGVFFPLFIYDFYINP